MWNEYTFIMLSTLMAYRESFPVQIVKWKSQISSVLIISKDFVKFVLPKILEKIMFPLQILHTK